MKPTRLVVLAIFVVPFISAIAARAQTSSIAGAWKVTMQFAQQQATGTLDLTVQDGAVSGTFTTAFAGGSVPLEGTFTGGKLTFTFSTTGGPHPGVQVDFFGTLQPDGSLAGKLTGVGDGETDWTAVRGK